MGYTGFRGTVNGAVQTTYTDQPGQAVAGMLAFASDLDQMDSVLVGEADGVACGAGVALPMNTASDPGNLQTPNVLATLPTADSTAADFGGVVVFEETAQSDTDGNPGWAKGRNCRVASNRRAGARIYIPAKDAITALTSTVNWVIAGGSDGKYQAGDFAPAALAGDATHGTSVAITTARWISSAAVGGFAVLELLGA